MFSKIERRVALTLWQKGSEFFIFEYNKPQRSCDLDYIAFMTYCYNLDTVAIYNNNLFLDSCGGKISI